MTSSLERTSVANVERGENAPGSVGDPRLRRASADASLVLSSEPGYDGGAIGYAAGEQVWCGETGVLISRPGPAARCTRVRQTSLSNADGGDRAPMAAPVPPSDFRCVCSWCSRVMREGRGAAAAFTTHSICPACYALVVSA